jgi:hypothetical protein
VIGLGERERANEERSRNAPVTEGGVEREVIGLDEGRRIGCQKERERSPKPLGPILVPRVVSAVGSSSRLKQSTKIKMSFIEVGN